MAEEIKVSETEVAEIVTEREGVETKVTETVEAKVTAVTEHVCPPECGGYPEFQPAGLEPGTRGLKETEG